ncbi:MFS transporter [Candidatus Saccharibacteria bacterium]|jgi:MFS family permease|nr:MFS transporter [Candidatus Saccharibacteria bacterium]
MVKQKQYQIKPTSELILVRVVHTLGMALFAVSSTLYFKSLGMSNAAIGLTTSIGLGLNLVYALLLPKILRTKNIIMVLRTSIAFISAMLFLFGFTAAPFQAIGVFIAFQIGLVTFKSAYGLLFHQEALSEDDYKKDRSLLGSLLCFSWTVGPLLATLLIEAFSFRTLFLFGAVLSLLSAIPLFVQKIPVHKKRVEKDLPRMLHALQMLLKNTKLRSTYLVASSTDMWWTYIMVFMTLFLKDAGYSDHRIGLFLTLTQLPLFLLEFAAYKVVERYRYKMPYRVAYAWLILALITTAVFGIGHIVSIIMLIAGSLSLAFIEPTEDMLFFDTVQKSEQSNLIPVFTTSNAFSGLVVRLVIGSTLVYFSPTTSIYVMIGVILFLITQTRHLKK